MNLRGKPAYADTAFRWLVIGAASLVLLILAYIAIAMTSRANVGSANGGVAAIASYKIVPVDQMSVR